jgi:hypothetical protein
VKVALLGALAAGLVLVLAACGGGGGGGGGGGDAAGGDEHAAHEGITAQEVCDRVELDTLHELTGDDWKEALPQKGFAGCEIRVTEDAPGRIYVSVSDIAQHPEPDPALARQFFDEETKYGGTQVPGVGDRAVYRASIGALTVLDDATIYKVQVLSDHTSKAAALEPAKRIYELLRG